jgi:choline dehydrogenase-like flavoprotein
MTDQSTQQTGERRHEDPSVSEPTNPYEPPDPANEQWDAIVIGTGMGGATAGHALAARGWRVLFLEKGRFLHGASKRPEEPGGFPDEQPAGRLDRGWWPYPIVGRTNLGNQRFFAPLGCGSGGTTTLYAAQLERLRPEDFQPRAHHAAATDSTLPDRWPIDYADLAPHYELAEKLYRVSGTTDPLGDAADGSALREPPPLSERDRELFESFEAFDLHPYRAHVGYEFVNDECTGCGGVVCPRACKSDAGRICLLPALRDFGARLLSDCEVVELLADAGSVRSVRCRWRGRDVVVRGRVVVLAAGAFASPILLLRSRSELWPNGLCNNFDQVGRNLMLHAHVWVAISSSRRLSNRGPIKSISLNDFYALPEGKLGTFQSLGITVSAGTVVYYLRSRLGKLPKILEAVAKPFVRVLGELLAIPFRNAAVFAGIIEDLPYAHNRVLPDPDTENGWRFEYHYPEELRRRSKLFFARLRRVLGPRHRLLMVSGKNNLDYGHVCGTLRFGSDPSTSVLDPSNRAHGVSNLYVVDASFFPSSGGTNLSLTIAANALRVGALIDQRLAEASRRTAEVI